MRERGVRDGPHRTAAIPWPAASPKKTACGHGGGRNQDVAAEVSRLVMRRELELRCCGIRGGEPDCVSRELELIAELDLSTLIDNRS